MPVKEYVNSRCSISNCRQRGRHAEPFISTRGPRRADFARWGGTRGPRCADFARWGGTRGDRHRRERNLSDAARARTAADGWRAAREYRAPRFVGHAGGRLAGPARRARGGASPVRVHAHRRDSDRRTATGPAVGPVRDPAPWVARTLVPNAAQI